MTTPTWHREALGIEPWPKHYFEWLDNTGRKVGTSAFTDPWYKPDADMQAVVNLEDGDVLAAFDRRLALRLGAPEEAVREGVIFYRYNGVWILSAGNPERYWWRNSNDGRFGEDTEDERLARVRAWNSVKEPKP